LQPENPSTIALLAESCAQTDRVDDAITLARLALDRGYPIESFKEDWGIAKLISGPVHRDAFERYRE
jgi:hypothetical protein